MPVEKFAALTLVAFGEVSVVASIETTEERLLALSFARISKVYDVLEESPVNVFEVSVLPTRTVFEP